MEHEEKIKHLLAYCEFDQVGPLQNHGMRVRHTLSGAIGESLDRSGKYANKRAAIDAMMSTPQFKRWYGGGSPSRTTEAYARFRRVLKDFADNIPDKIEDSPYTDYMMWHLEELLEIIIEKIDDVKYSGSQEHER